MTFQPVIVGSGLSGWQFLKSTGDRQREVFNQSTLITRDTEYFRQNIANITSAEDLVDDRRLLRVALGAFGLQDDINSKFFVRKILEEGVTDRLSLANKLTDDRYKALAGAFDFDLPVSRNVSDPDFANDIVNRFRAQEFEIAVGNQDQTLRLALNFERSVEEMADADISDNARWFRVMGTPPIRTVLETALGLPSSFGQLDIDQQLDIFREKSRSRFGVTEIKEFADLENTRKIVQTYLLQEKAKQIASVGSGNVALTLLQAIPRRSI